MPFKIKFLKFISLTLFILLFNHTINAQKVKIDAVGVVVGKNIVLDSDIEKFKLELENSSEGKIKISDCEMLEQLMLQKLLAHHAVVDSIIVSDAEVNDQVERNIQFFSQEYGSIEKVVEAYGFNDIEDLKKELFGIEKENSLIQKEQRQITENIDVTPEEIERILNKLNQLKKEIEEGSSIKMKAIINSNDPGVTDNGGRYRSEEHTSELQSR